MAKSPLQNFNNSYSRSDQLQIVNRPFVYYETWGHNGTDNYEDLYGNGFGNEMSQFEKKLRYFAFPLALLSIVMIFALILYISKNRRCRAMKHSVGSCCHQICYKMNCCENCYIVEEMDSDEDDDENFEEVQDDGQNIWGQERGGTCVTSV